MDTWLGNATNPITLNKYIYADADPANGIDPSGNMTLAQVGATLSIGSVLAVASYPSFKNLLAIDTDGVPTATEIGISVLLQMVGSNSSLLNMVFSDPNEKSEYLRIEDELQSEVDRLRERDTTESISVPRPPRKKGWYTCIARAQDLGRTIGSNPVFGWGWGLSKDFQIAKNQAVQMANSSIGAIDTHHAQWRCLDPKGNVLKP